MVYVNLINEASAGPDVICISRSRRGRNTPLVELHCLTMAVDKTVDVKYYLERRFRDPEDKERGVQPFYLKSISDFYKNFGGYWNSSSCRLLEFGGGPCIYPLISAAPYVSEITFADIDQGSLDAVQAWKNNSEDAHDWSSYFEYVISQLEEEKEELKDKYSSRQEELKKKLANFLVADIRTDQVFENDMLAGKYDIVSTNFCFDSVAETFEEYKAFVKRIKHYVKKGGFLAGLVSLEETYWQTSYGEHKSHLYLTKEDVIATFQEMGFRVESSKIFTIDESARFKINDCKALLFIVGNLVE